MAAARRLMLALLGLLIIVLGAAIAVQTVASLFGVAWPAPQWWATTWMGTQISDRRVLLTSAAIAVIGMLIVVAQLVPRRQRRLPTTVEGPYWVRRRGAEKRLVAVANQAGMTAHGHAEIRAKPDRWRVQVSGDAPRHRRGDVEHAVRNELSGLGAPADHKLTMALREPGRVS